MSNHYHFVLETPRGNVSAAMRFVNGVYTQASNRRHGRTGHVFEGRFTSVLIDNDHYLRNANVYVVRNPVEAGLVTRAREWPWSSYRATAGIVSPPESLSVEWIDWVFRGRTRAESQRRYRAFVAGPPPGVEAGITEQLLHGSPAFEEDVRSEIGATLHQVRLPRSYRALARPPLSDFFGARLTKRERNSRILRAHVVHGYQLTEIAACLRLHPNTLSRIVQALRSRCS